MNYESDYSVAVLRKRAAGCRATAEQYAQTIRDQEAHAATLSGSAKSRAEACAIIARSHELHYLEMAIQYEDAIRLSRCDDIEVSP